jgi:hypothetical protein
MRVIGSAVNELIRYSGHEVRWITSSANFHLSKSLSPPVQCALRHSLQPWKTGNLGTKFSVNSKAKIQKTPKQSGQPDARPVSSTGAIKSVSTVSFLCCLMTDSIVPTVTAFVASATVTCRTEEQARRPAAGNPRSARPRPIHSCTRSPENADATLTPTGWRERTLP